MDVRAAIAFEAGQPLRIETVQLDGPRAGEVLVEIKATGICHTDEFTLSGADPEGLFPAILGHEGAGIVVEVGAGVTTLKKGDHVIPLYTPECRQCRVCLSRKTNLCTAIRATQGKGVMPDGSSRFSFEGEPVLHYMGSSTFANYTVLPEIALAKIREDAPFEKICYIGCGVTTGDRRGLFTAEGRGRRQGRRVRAGRHRPERDPGRADGRRRPDRRRGHQSRARGDGAEVRHDRTSSTRRRSTGDTSWPTSSSSPTAAPTTRFECIGNPTLMRQALECAHRGWGVSTVIGVAGAGQEIARARSSSSPGASGRAARSAAPAAAPTCRRSSTGTWTARSTSTT